MQRSSVTPVGTMGWCHKSSPEARHVDRRRGNDDVRLAERRSKRPFLGVGEVGHRHVGRIILDGALVDPRHHRRDVFVREPPVVLELLDADVAVVVVRRHHPVRDLLLDAARITTGIVVGHQVHGPDPARPVANLAILLDDGRYVPGVRHIGDVIRRRESDLSVRNTLDVKIATSASVVARSVDFQPCNSMVILSLERVNCTSIRYRSPRFLPLDHTLVQNLRAGPKARQGPPVAFHPCLQQLGIHSRDPLAH